MWRSNINIKFHFCSSDKTAECSYERHVLLACSCSSLFLWLQSCALDFSVVILHVCGHVHLLVFDLCLTVVV